MRPLCFNGGDKEDRTPDLQIANLSLSQLSYIPNLFISNNRYVTNLTLKIKHYF